jgi:predicted O-methyltransferase YrrM
MESDTSLNFEHLKSFNSSEGYWSTTACVSVARDVLDVTEASSILEIGFNIGYSTSVWLELGVSRMGIIDINNHEDTVPALHAVKSAYKDRNIIWKLCDSKSEEAKTLKGSYELAFIDGEHSYEAAYKDSLLSIEYGCKWLLYDDVIEEHSNGIYEAISNLEEQGKIEIVKSYFMSWTGAGYVVLCKVIKDETS